jgi:hypothetical protein
MKSCPKCNRTFPDETQKFCTFDGGLLISSQPFDPNATVRTTPADTAPTPSRAEEETSRDLGEYATLIDRSATIGTTRGDTAPTGGQSTTIGLQNPTPTPPPATPPPATAPPPPVTPPPQAAPPPPPTPALIPPPAVAPPAVEQAPETVLGVAPPTTVPPKKKSKAPLIIGLTLLLLLLGLGGLAGAFFLFIKPRLDQTAQQVPSPEPTLNTNTNTTTPTPAVEASPAPTEEYVPPAGTTQFVNAKENLDGKLAEHYFDFSFYYPSTWSKDPKAGVPGAANFARVERHLPPDFTQESFSVGWYTSAGSFVADLPNFPKRAEEFSAALSKNYPEYEKISEGPTKINSMDAYEFRWKGLSRGTEKGDIQLWGRVVFLPTGKEGDSAGATFSMLTTSLAGELSSVEDVGERGQMPVILQSFRFGKKQ